MNGPFSTPLVNYDAGIPIVRGSNSVNSGSNLQSMIQSLQGNSQKPPPQQQQQSQNPFSQFNTNFGNQAGDNAMTGGAPSAQTGLNSANAAFGTYDPASAGLSSANDIFGTFDPAAAGVGDAVAAGGDAAASTATDLLPLLFL